MSWHLLNRSQVLAQAKGFDCSGVAKIMNETPVLEFGRLHRHPRDRLETLLGDGLALLPDEAQASYLG